MLQLANIIIYPFSRLIGYIYHSILFSYDITAHFKSFTRGKMIQI